MPPVNAKCPQKLGTNGHDQGHLALTEDIWHWLGTNGIDWKDIRHWPVNANCPSVCWGQMASTSQCQMSLSVFGTNGIVQSMPNVPPYLKGYPFVHSQPTLWTNQRLAFDALDQWEALISATFRAWNSFWGTNGIDWSMQNVPPLGSSLLSVSGTNGIDQSMPKVPP